MNNKSSKPEKTPSAVLAGGKAASAALGLAAVLLLAAGVAPHVVQERLGHKRIEITLSVYAHVLPGQQRAVQWLVRRRPARLFFRQA